ncbi:Ubiquitin-domain-containing protein [Mycena sanguinolenta]|uniref:Ubiquitin-domain-containing protein n=1 Tax=Mycena sanguinolenta TaxID=230812 RepID=A0A8H7CQC4_9AGAR|nr:Ubiquitin-domain-containing protein [Mycena sanguinolenta]
MADQAEVAFLRVYLNTLTAQPIIYTNEYQQPPQNSLKKVPVLQISVPTPPRRSASTSGASTSGSASSSGITLTFKSLKPPASFTLSGVDPADSILALKQRLESSPNGPPVAAQRLLLKGKALADAKLVKEYPISDGDTNLVLKSIPATTTDTDITMTDAPSNLTPGGPTDRPVKSAAEAAAHPRRHTRIPSVVLSPAESPSTSPGASVSGLLSFFLTHHACSACPACSPWSGQPLRNAIGGDASCGLFLPITNITLTTACDIILTLDADADHAGLPSEEISTYHAKLAEPEFWRALLEFLKTLHRIYMYIEVQQKTKFKLFRNIEMNNMVQDCYAELDEAKKIFEVNASGAMFKEVKEMEKAAETKHKELLALISTLSETNTTTDGSLPGQQLDHNPGGQWST